MKRYIIIAAIFFILGVLMRVMYTIQGSSVAPDGTLIENFGLIPLSLLCFLLSMIFLIIILVKNLTARIKRNNKNAIS
ncbi:MAG: DUF3955 domain-containing protein [Ostreibacterium sp.]